MKIAHCLYSVFFITLSCGCLCPSVSLADNSPRQTINFNREWKYSKDDFKEAAQSAFDDKKWENIGLPHSFSMPYFMSKDFYVGCGWHRKHFTLSAKELAKKVFLEFDGVFQEAEVFVNGKTVGTHVGGYTGFSLDISSAVWAGKNLVAIRVNNIWHTDIAPRAGEDAFSGGIYRNVRLGLKFSAYIDWYATQITTPELKENQSKASAVKVTTDICNRTAVTSAYKLVTEVVDKSGKVVASVQTVETIRPNTTKQFEQTTSNVLQPMLWSPEHPILYKVVSLFYQGKKLMDRDETVFGFRWMNWTADKGFFLNG